MNLFEALSKKHKVFAFFTYNTKIKRNENFYQPSNSVVQIHFAKSYSIIKKLIKLNNYTRSCDKIYVGGWDEIWHWWFVFNSPKRKNILILESSILDINKESRFFGYFKKILKRLFLKRIEKCITSGIPHKTLLESLNFEGEIIISSGVGVLNFDYPPILKPQPKLTPKKGLFIGRIGRDKGVDLIVEAIKINPNLNVGLIGDVENNFELPIHERLKYLGYKKRSELKSCFAEYDFLILPSRIEPWGLVIEEAIYHGLPVIISDKVGCKIDVVEKYNIGLIFESGNLEDFINKISSLQQLENYLKLSNNINIINFEDRKINYINSFASL